MPGGDEPCHRLAQLARALMRPLQMRPTLLHQTAANELDGQRREQRDLRIGREDFLRRDVERLRDREPALDPRTCRLRSSLQMVHLGMHDARSQRQHRIVRRGRQRLGALRYRKCLRILAAQAQHVPEPVQQARAQCMLGRAGQQRIRALEGVLRFAAEAERLEGRQAAQRRDADLQRIALRPLRRLLQ